MLIYYLVDHFVEKFVADKTVIILFLSVQLSKSIGIVCARLCHCSGAWKAFSDIFFSLFKFHVFRLFHDFAAIYGVHFTLRDHVYVLYIYL